MRGIRRSTWPRAPECEAAGGAGGRRTQGDAFAVLGDLDLLEAIEIAQDVVDASLVAATKQRNTDDEKRKPGACPRTGRRSPPSCARRTATFDNGGEWARHERVCVQLGMRTYFCDPHSPWQRGGIENANGVLRRDVPRHANLAGYSDHDLDALLWAFNTTPRKCLGYETPIEAFARQLGVALEM